MSRGDIPVDRPNFVARLVFTNVFKVHSAAFEDAVVIAGKCGLDEAPRFYLEGSDFFENLSGVHG